MILRLLNHIEKDCW